MNDEIMVSVNCLVYNHEKYLRQCLEGLVSQKTTFKFEVLVHDDASTDKTADIIREYEAKYPDIIKPIYQKENQWSKGVKISYKYQYPRAKGKYIAWCEGDDYWCDENKLQLQVDAMEDHPECAMCVHGTNCVNEDGSLNERRFPIVSFQEGIVNGFDILKQYPKWLFHLTSLLVKKEIVMKIINSHKELREACPVGDTLILYFSASCGNYYYIDKAMSVYRLFSAGSWTSRIRQKGKIAETNDRFIHFTEAFGDYLETNYPIDLSHTIDSAIKQYNIDTCLFERNYKKAFYFKDCEYFESLTSKQKAIIYLSRFLPGFERFYQKYQEKKRKINGE